MQSPTPGSTPAAPSVRTDCTLPFGITMNRSDIDAASGVSSSASTKRWKQARIPARMRRIVGSRLPISPPDTRGEPNDTVGPSSRVGRGASASAASDDATADEAACV